MPALLFLLVALDAENPVVIDDQRRMLGEAWLPRQARGAHAAAHAGGEQVVVEAIAQVEQFGLLAVRPPTELVALTADFAQGIDVAHAADHFIHPGPLRSEETR